MDSEPTDNPSGYEPRLYQKKEHISPLKVDHHTLDPDSLIKNGGIRYGRVIDQECVDHILNRTKY